MGIESVSYRFEPASADVAELVDWLRLHGAVSGDRHGTFIIAGTDHWIDLLVRDDGQRALVVQFRVAITNPLSVVATLDRLISELHAHFVGRVTDAAGRVLEDEDTLSLLRDDFSRGRSRFTEIYGDVMMPISADHVFARLRAAEGNSPA
jgi:hypothetical protein